MKEAIDSSGKNQIAELLLSEMQKCIKLIDEYIISDESDSATGPWHTSKPTSTDPFTAVILHNGLYGIACYAGYKNLWQVYIADRWVEIAEPQQWAMILKELV